MSEPSGRLAWGQAGIYDAVDDRAVIATTTGYRTGLVAPATVRAGAGLQVILTGGWAGVADCGDGTSAVVGSRTDTSTDAAPGPPTGSRTDLLWCDVEPDEGEWHLVVIPASATAGRPGIPLAQITVPANATLASQMTIAPAEATLERRILGMHTAVATGTSNAQTWEAAQPLVWNNDVIHRPGRWYRVKFALGSARGLTGGSGGAGWGGSFRIGVGWHASGTPGNTAVLARSTTITFPAYGTTSTIVCEHIFRHPLTAATVSRNWVGRMWSVGAGTFNPQSLTGQGDQTSIYTEDLGS